MTDIVSKPKTDTAPRAGAGPMIEAGPPPEPARPAPSVGQTPGQTPGQIPGQTLALHIDLGSPALARGVLGTSLAASGCPTALVGDCLMVVTELIMNALLHGEGDSEGQVHLRWHVADDGTVTLSVTDSGGFDVPHVEAPEAGESGGRGLQLIDALCDSWSIDAGDGHPTTVSATLSSAEDPRSAAR